MGQLPLDFFQSFHEMEATHRFFSFSMKWGSYSIEFSVFALSQVVDFRGYGYSTGSPSLGTLGSDGERVVAALPGFLRAKQLPWPWPGRMALLGRHAQPGGFGFLGDHALLTAPKKGVP